MPRFSLKKYAVKPRVYATLGFVLVFALGYLGTNHLALWTPRVLPFFGWEKGLPFLPWTVLIYMLTYVQVLLVFWAVDRKDLGKAAAGMIGLIFLHSLFFFFYPTYFPRPALPSDVFPIFGSLYRLLVFFDTPRNCFPSLHAAESLFATFVFWRIRPRYGLPSFVLTLLIIVSALTLKQHYFLDMVGGTFTAVVFYLYVFHARGSRCKSY